MLKEYANFFSCKFNCKKETFFLILYLIWSIFLIPCLYESNLVLWYRNLRELDLRDSEVDDLSGHWLNHFPDTYTSLVSLNISCLGSDDVSFSALERLVGRCPNLRRLLLNREVPLDKIANLLSRAPQLIEFGTGTYAAELRSDVYSNLAEAFCNCKELKCLSGFWDAVPAYLPVIYSVCSRLTSLNLSYAPIQNPDLTKLVSQCPSLQRMLVSPLRYHYAFEFIPIEKRLGLAWDKTLL